MFHGLFIKKYSFDFVRGCIFRVIRVKTKMSKVRKSIFGIFYFFITEKNAVQTRKKSYAKSMEKVLLIVNPVSKTGFQNFVSIISTLKMHVLKDQLKLIKTN